MSAALILGLVGGLLVVAFLANRVFGLTRIPDVLVLMMLGVLLRACAGPGAGRHAGQDHQPAGHAGHHSCAVRRRPGAQSSRHPKTFSRKLPAGHAGLHFQHGAGRGDCSQGPGSVVDGRSAGGRGARLHQQHGGTAGLAAAAGGRTGPRHADARSGVGRCAGGAHGGTASGHAQPGRGGGARAGTRLVESGRDRAAVRHPRRAFCGRACCMCSPSSVSGRCSLSRLFSSCMRGWKRSEPTG